MISIKQINYALTVAKTLHFRKAAEICFVSPSTLSNAITEMESQLGVKIFERDNKKVFVTELGREILEKSKEIKVQLEDIQKISESTKAPLSHNLSIGIIPTVSPFILPYLLPKLRADYPKLKLKVTEAQSENLLFMLENGEIDMAILALPYNIRGLKSFKFWEENFYWISTKEDNRSKSNKIKAEELDLNELILLEEGNCLKDHVLSACKISNDTHHDIKTTSLNTLIQLVKGGMGTTLIPEMALEQLIKGHENLSMTELDESGPHREIAIIVRQNYSGIRDAEILSSILKRELELRFSKQ
ncbi:MAG: LysR family transcriptional regulator [Gammaproteobacteria bacterium]|nr:LysR family transcriptional regulator [Gammaproteobacteria bacterium]